MVSEHPQWFASKPPINYKHRIEDNDKTILKEYDKEGRGVMIVKLGKNLIIHIESNFNML